MTQSLTQSVAAPRGAKCKTVMSSVLGTAGLFDDKVKLNGYRVKGFHCRAKDVSD